MYEDSLILVIMFFVVSTFIKECLSRHLAHYLEIENLEKVIVIIFHFSRCFDANLVEIPVEVEDPGCYYYHVRSY